jgi:hypothetical protein
MAQHIILGTTPPTITPTKLGQHYIDTVTKIPYVSVGTASSADWAISYQDLSGKENVGVAAGLDSAHTTSFAHGDIAHTNRTALNNVSGVNTGDQDLAGLVHTNRTELDLVSGTNTGDQTISDASISITDLITNNVSTLKHGFFPKLPAATGKYLKDDLTWGTPAGGGSSAKTIVELDFGTLSTGSSFTITDALVSSTSLITMQFIGNQATGRYADEYEFADFSIKCIAGTGNFIARITPLNGTIGGKYKFFYQL